jgi:hypothetical protein
MWNDPESHFEDKELMDKLIDIISDGEGKKGDVWHADRPFTQEQCDDVLDMLREYRNDWGDMGMKNPRLIFFMKELMEVYPDAKYIFCLRNPNDWIQSNAKYGRSGMKWELILRQHYDYVIEQMMRYFNDNTFLFDYDNVDEKALNKFLGFDLDLSDFERRTYQ